MNKLACNSRHNERLIKFFMDKAYPDGIPDIYTLIEDNVIDGSQLAELAVSKASGISIHDIGHGQDLIDGSDVKTSTVQYYTRKKKVGNGTIYEHSGCQIKIKNIRGKIGILRCIVYNPFFDKWFFFLIPKDVRMNIKHLKISFDKKNGEPTGKYAMYQVPDWESVCAVEEIFA